MTRAVLSIGSNLGDRLANLRSVVSGLGERLVACSSVYETAPWGGVEQEPFLNAVVIAEDADADCRDWLHAGWRWEADAQRERKVRWGPRTLDVDVIVCLGADGDEIVSEDPELILPHPHAHERAFVLAPWYEIDAHAALSGTSIGALLDGMPADERDGVRRTGLSLTARPGGA